METINKPSVEELLKPRYRVIADYPGSAFQIDQIIVPELVNERHEFPSGVILKLTAFPHLFRKLEWWEDRKPEEMPEYVEYAENGMVAKVHHFDLETTSPWFMYLEGGVHPYCPGGSALENTHWIPATHDEYLAYINSATPTSTPPPLPQGQNDIMTDQIEQLKALHYEIRELIEAKKWNKLNDRLKHIRFQHDVNRSKTALIITQSLVNHPEIMEERYKLYQWFNQDMGWPHMEWPINKMKDVNVPDKYKKQ